jgi:hypothetical protein
MMYFNKKRAIRSCVVVFGTISLLTIPSMAQYGGGGGTSGGGASSGGTSGGSAAATAYNFHNNYHLSFERPEAWGLKYFASASMLSGLQPPEPAEGRRIGSVTLGLEMGWLPTLDAGQRQIGFNGSVPEDLNKAPIFVRPVLRVGLPAKFTLVVAAPPPFHMFGVTSHLFEFGVERPILERERWTLSWRGYGQVGSIKGAFTCPRGVSSFAPGSPDNPTECVAESADVASLRYAGSEFQLAYRIPSMPKLIPHVAAGGNFIDGVFQTHAQVADGLDETRLWTRGGTFSGTAGVSYVVTKRAVFTVDAFYSPLWVQRSPNAPRTNDPLFNIRALLSYNFR